MRRLDIIENTAAPGLTKSPTCRSSTLRHDAVVGRHHRRVGEIEPGPVELGLGGADRRMAIDIDIRIAVQRDHGVGDLLFDRYDVLTGDLEIHVGSVKDLARRPTVGDERFPSRILTLVEVRGIASPIAVRPVAGGRWP